MLRNLSSFLIVSLLFCSACSTVQPTHKAGAPVVEGTKTVSGKEAVVQPSKTAPPKSNIGEPSAGTSIDLPAPDRAPPATADSVKGREVGESTAISKNPAVIALLNETDSKIRQGSADGAAGSIERALRLEPKNPWLWHRLAVLRFQQGQWRQAITLAEKSNSLSIRQPELRKANSELIKQARRH